MTNVLKNSVKEANALVLLINSEQQRFSAALQQMIREMQALFGELFWQNTIIGVSHWAYDANSIAKRNYTGMTEEKFLGQWNSHLKTKFHINVTLPGVFIDSFSQQPWNKPDSHQQEIFKQQTDKLWDFAENESLFAFKTVEDVLEENHKLKQEVQWLNDIITKNITDLQKKLTSASNDIKTNQDLIKTNKEEIKDNKLTTDELKSDFNVLSQVCIVLLSNFQNHDVLPYFTEN